MILTFGKYKGRAVAEVDDSYLEWLLDQDWVKSEVKLAAREEAMNRGRDVGLENDELSREFRSMFKNY